MWFFTRLTDGFDPIGGGGGGAPIPSPSAGAGGAMRWLLVFAAMIVLFSVTLLPLISPSSAEDPVKPQAAAGSPPA